MTRRRTVIPAVDTWPKGERGAVLIVSLLLLLIMTIIGVTALTTNSLEERIAGNLRDQNLAFQASESAVRACETYVLNTTLGDPTHPFLGTCANGLCLPAAPPPAVQVWQDTTLNVWNGTTKSQQIPDPPDPKALLNVVSQPRYIIEYLGAFINGVPVPGESIVIGHSDDRRWSLYRCTARGVGGTATAVVMNQSIYKKL